MKDAANLGGVRSGANKEEPEFFSPLESLYVAFAGIRKAMQRGKDTHGCFPIQAANIGLGRFGPHDPLHLGSLKRSISSWVTVRPFRPVIYDCVNFTKSSEPLSTGGSYGQR